MKKKMKIEKRREKQEKWKKRGKCKEATLIIDGWQKSNY